MARLVYWLAWILAIAVVWFFLSLPSHAHMADRPDLDKWFMGLRSEGSLCCDFSEAEKIADPDWDSNNGHYKVLLEGKWWDVPDTAVVKDPNRYGPALAWPIRYPQTPDSKGPIVGIRCFLPGAGT